MGKFIAEAPITTQTLGAFYDLYGDGNGGLAIELDGDNMKLIIVCQDVGEGS